MTIELNRQFKKALKILENGSEHVFITGEAGTGKSTLLQHFRYSTDHKVAVLAPTGVAAHNIDGQTIHSFFHFKPGTTAEEVPEIAKKASKKQKAVLKALDAIIIDEISMVRADLLDMIDDYLQRVFKNDELFGGMRMIFIGDLYQLPPVVTKDDRESINSLYTSPYFFSARALRSLFTTKPESFVLIELTKIYRQTDQEFVRLLNAIRARLCTQEDVDLLNQRQEEAPPLKENEVPYMYLTTRNAEADERNEHWLSQLSGDSVTYWADTSGQLNRNEFPAPETIELKVGARVMLVNNDREGRWVNGSLGLVSELGYDWVKVTLDNGKEYEIYPTSWEVYTTTFNEEKKTLQREVVGSFTQLPIVLAWAITIHKSQGKTFDRVVVDLTGGAFAEGQVYVALSRCRTLEGLYLVQPLRLQDIRINPRVSIFMKWLRERATDAGSG